MSKTKSSALESHGSRVGSAKDFLKLTQEESLFVDRRPSPMGAPLRPESDSAVHREHARSNQRTSGADALHAGHHRTAA